MHLRAKAEVAGPLALAFQDNVSLRTEVILTNALKDSSGNIIRISEIPFSESGDWIIILTHYFDKAGKTFAHKRQADFYNSICTDGMAHDERVEYYDSNNKLLEKTQTLVDDKKNTLQKESCQFPYEYEYRISEDLGKYLQTKHLKIN